jgi:hypothetical protein
MESVLSRCVVSGNIIVTVLVKEVLWEVDMKNTATRGSPSNLRITVRRLRLKCDGTCAETRFRLSAKRTVNLSRRGRQISRLLCARQR